MEKEKMIFLLLKKKQELLEKLKEEESFVHLSRTKWYFSERKTDKIYGQMAAIDFAFKILDGKKWFNLDYVDFVVTSTSGFVSDDIKQDLFYRVRCGRIFERRQCVEETLYKSLPILKRQILKLL